MQPARPLAIILLSASAVEAGLGSRTAPAIPLSPHDLLRSVGRFSQAEWAAVERGESVARLIETGSREIAVVGAVRIAGSREALIARYRDIERLKQSPLVLDAGRLSMLPTVAELARLPIEEYSLNLRECRPGSCAVRLGAAAVERFQHVNWRSPDWRTQSASIWREVLTSYAAAYMTSGRQGLPTYVNKGVPLSVSDEIGVLLDEYAFVASYSPDFYAYLQRLGPHTPPGSEQTLYWTKEDFGVRPLVRISHQIVYRLNDRNAAFIATNQVYADHYLDAALSLTVTLDGTHGRDFYMIVVNRGRTRSLEGILRRFVRSTVQNRSRDALRRILTNTQSAVQAQTDAR
jgi:hypothetical protein